MKIIKKIGLTLLVLIVVIGIVGLFLPAQRHLERSIVIKAEQDQVFSILNSFKSFNQWSPWYKLDPDAEYSYSGPESGVGAAMTWASDKPDVGNGAQKILESTANDYIKVALDFGNDVAESTYRLKQVSQGTEVIWEFDADFGYNIAGRYFGLMLESLLGPSYEEGLRNLKDHLEPKKVDNDPE